MKRAFTALLILATLLAASAGAFAQEEKTIVTVDLKRVMLESKKGIKVKSDFDQKVGKLDAKAGALEKEAREMASEMERQGALLTDAVKREKQERFIAIRGELGSLEKQRNKINDEMTLGIITEIQGVIKTLSQEKGYKLVLGEGGAWLLYADKTLDVTDEVMARLDAKEGK